MSRKTALALAIMALPVTSMAASGLMDFSNNTSGDAVASSVKNGVFKDSSLGDTGVSSGDMCQNIPGIQESVPANYSLIAPGVCRTPCVENASDSYLLTIPSDCNTGESGYVLNTTKNSWFCTWEYGTRSDLQISSVEERRCYKPNLTGTEFKVTGSIEEKNAANSNGNIGISIQFESLMPNSERVLPPKGTSIIASSINSAIYEFNYEESLKTLPVKQSVEIKSYMVCNGEFAISQVIVGKDNSVSPNPMTGTTVSGQWYNSGVSDSSCVKRNFAGSLYLYNQYWLKNHPDTYAAEQNLSTLWLRGINTAAKTKSEPNNGFRVVFYTNYNAQEVEVCVAKQDPVTLNWNHNSGCRNKANTRVTTFVTENTSVTSYKNSIPAQPPYPTAIPGGEAYDPYTWPPEQP